MGLCGDASEFFRFARWERDPIRGFRDDAKRILWVRPLAEPRRMPNIPDRGGAFSPAETAASRLLGDIGGFRSPRCPERIGAARSEDSVRAIRETHPVVEAWILGCGGRREAGVS